MIDVIGNLIPLGLAASFSPFPVIAVILVLLSERAKTNGWAFLAGWMLAIGAVSVAMTTIARAVEPADPDASAPLTGVVRIAVGMLLLVLAVRKLRAGPKLDEAGDPVLPGWMSTLATASAWRTFVMAVLLAAANPKNLALSLAAGFVIGAGATDGTQVAWGIASFIVVASVSIIVAVLGHALFAKQLDPALSRLEQWLLANQHAVMALLFVVFGLVLISGGITSF